VENDSAAVYLRRRVTLADIDAFVVIDFAGWIKGRVPESRVGLQAWYQRIKTLLPPG
jgi:glutathione S-transferase